MSAYFDRIFFLAAAGGTGAFTVSSAVQGYRTPAGGGIPDGTQVTYIAESADKSQWELGVGTYTVSSTSLSRDTIRSGTNGTSAVNFSVAPRVFIDLAAAELAALPNDQTWTGTNTFSKDIASEYTFNLRNLNASGYVTMYFGNAASATASYISQDSDGMYLGSSTFMEMEGGGTTLNLDGPSNTATVDANQTLVRENFGADEVLLSVQNLSTTSGSTAAIMVKNDSDKQGWMRIPRTGNLEIGTDLIGGSISFKTEAIVRVTIGSAGIDITEISTPGNPAANVARLYAKDVSTVTKLAYRDSAGTETVLSAGVDPTRTLTAGAGLTGGGTLAADRTFDVGAGTGITVAADTVGLDTAHARNIDHTTVTFIAGVGLVGGGDISNNRTFDVGAGTGITVNTDNVALTVPVVVANGGTGATSAGTALSNLGGQPLDATLTALAGLNATAGLLEQTGVDAFTKRLIGVTNSTDIPTRADADTRYVNVSGDTLTGDLAIDKANPQFNLDKSGSLEEASITGSTAGSLRWQMTLGDATAESGSNAGSNFKLESFTDGGAPQSTALTISRATGLVTIAGDPTAALGIATKQMVDLKAPTSRQVIAGFGLTGGGDLSADRTFDVGGGTGITVNADGIQLTIPVVAGLGGTGLTSYFVGDLLYASGTSQLDRLPGNQLAARRFLRQTGTGSASAAPVWDALTAADVPASALTKTDDTNVTLTFGGSPTTALLAATSITVGWTGTLAVARGGTGSGTAAGALTNLGAVAKAGDTMTGTLSINPGSGSSGIAITANAQYGMSISGTPHSTVGMLHIRPNSGSAGYITITENAVLDKWAIGCDAGSGAGATLNFRQTNATGTVVASLTSAGLLTLTNDIARTGGVDIEATNTNDDANAGQKGEYKANWLLGTNARSGTVTITIASPAVITWSGHPFFASTTAVTAVSFTTTGALPTGITAGTIYYATYVSANTFKISTTVANAMAGTYVNTSGTQSGTHTADIRVSQTSASPRDLAAIQLTAGDWDVEGIIYWIGSGTTVISQIYAALSTSSGTGSTFEEGRNASQQFPASYTPGSIYFNNLIVPTARFPLSGTSTIHLTFTPNFTTSTMIAFAAIRARRQR